jgi:serine/threonine-protein kinase
MGEVAPNALIAGRYELEVPLGRGGMGEVWRARHVALHSQWAIKFLHSASAQKESTRRRFEKEAQVTSQLKTRFAVQVFDFGITEGGQPYLVMELLDGETVGHRLERLGRLSVPTTVAFLTQAARALERAHALGIVHRDLKPDNLVIVTDEDGREYIKVLDFGIAKLLGELDSELEAEDQDATLLKLSTQSFTRTGSILGTPAYMAPEQVKEARNVDLRADIWAFGVLAFECLTGMPPFEGKDIFDLFDRIQGCFHAPATDFAPSLPPEFDQWFEIACAIDPAKRFPSAKAAASTLAVALGQVPRGADGHSGPTLEPVVVPEERLSRSGEKPIDRSTWSGRVLSRRRRSVGDMSGTGAHRAFVPEGGNVEVSPAAQTVQQSVPPPASSAQALIETHRTQKASAARLRLALAASAVLGLVAVVAWAVSRGSAGPAAPSAPVATTSVAPVPTASARAALPEVTASSPPAAPEGVSSSAASASSVAAANPKHPAAKTPFAARSVAIPETAAPPPPAPTPSAPPPKPPPAHSAASPFELPPLGL